MSVDRYNFVKRSFESRKHQLLKKNSKAESHFAKLLDKTSYYYIREKCCYDKNGEWCYIDFFIPIFNLAIEIDGEEHRNPKNHKRDIQKEKFLSEKRDITTWRISNKDCLKLESIDILSIVKGIRKKSPVSDGVAKHIIYSREKERERDLKNAQKKAKFNVNNRIYAYCKLNDKIYEFKDLYMLKRSILTEYKHIIRTLNETDNIHASNTFIFSFDMDSLNQRIERYYNELWEGK